MDQVVQDPTFQVSAIQQCLSGGKSPIGLFLGGRLSDSNSPRESVATDPGHQGYYPVFPILGVFRLKGQPKRDDGMIVRSCKARQSPVYPLNASSRTGLGSTKTPMIRLVVEGRERQPSRTRRETGPQELR